jgi:predicted O-methyltransferase YrrM
MLRMAQKAIRHPHRAILRLLLLKRLGRNSVQQDRAHMLKAISECWDVDAGALALEYRRSKIARWYQRRLRLLGATFGSARMGTSEDFACELLYVLVRAARPEVVVETGVLYGASSCHILAGLAENGSGELHSIDLGTRADEPSHDYLVHPELTRRWNYIKGDVKTELPALLARIQQIDMFYHDSLHTFKHMTWEYDTASRSLRPDGVLASHDVQVSESLLGIFRENAFPAFCQRQGVPCVKIRNSGFSVWRPVRLKPRLQLAGYCPA